MDNGIPSRTHNCNVSEKRLEVLEEGHKEIKNEQKELMRQMIENNAVTKELATAVPELTKAITDIHIGINNTNNNVKNIEEKVDRVLQNEKENDEALEELEKTHVKQMFLAKYWKEFVVFGAIIYAMAKLVGIPLP